MVRSKLEVVCVGVATLDTIALVAKYPAADERVKAEDLQISLGGPAAVAAVTLARLGVSVGWLQGSAQMSLGNRSSTR
jgi:sulfofructose kinase